MLDLGLSKMALIGVVALVVLGPERLPRVARTAGALFGRAQRYINDVKAEVSREIELDALRTMKTDFESAARNVETTIHDNLREHEKELNDTWNSAVGGLNEGSVDAGTYGSDTPAAPSWRGTASSRSTTTGAYEWTARRHSRWRGWSLSKTATRSRSATTLTVIAMAS